MELIHIYINRQIHIGKEHFLYYLHTSNIQVPENRLPHFQYLPNLHPDTHNPPHLPSGISTHIFEESWEFHLEVEISGSTKVTSL